MLRKWAKHLVMCRPVDDRLFMCIRLYKRNASHIGRDPTIARALFMDSVRCLHKVYVTGGFVLRSPREDYRYNAFRA